MPLNSPDLLKKIAEIKQFTRFGTVHSVNGIAIDVVGLDGLAIGSQLVVDNSEKEPLACEVVGFSNGIARCLPFGRLQGIAPDARVTVSQESAVIFPSPQWKGRVINGMGQPIDDIGPLPEGEREYPIHAAPPPAAKRQILGDRINLGVAALNLFTPCCVGQRLGIFAASGVGKSLLLAMLARHVECDTIVVGLIGERGREVREFTQQHLGETGRARSVVVVATSDEPALIRKRAAEITLTVAEYFRDRGEKVLCVMDSVTRFATAQREIGLANREPPTTRGFPTSVFSELPRLLERAGPGMTQCQGSVTGLFTILVDGDDHDEPVADATRAILDGHVVLDRKIAERGRFPAVNALRSVSRSSPQCLTKHEERLWLRAKQILARYSDIEELVRIGAYSKGTNHEIDEALDIAPKIDQMLHQNLHHGEDIASTFSQLEAILQS